MERIKRWVQAAGDVLFPPVCVHCGQLVENSGFRHLCASCAPSLSLANPPCCTTCGYPFCGEMAENRLCEHCAQLKPVYREGRTMMLLKGPGRSLVHALKYRRALYVLDDVESLVEGLPGMDGYLRGAWLVPVPLHPRKLRERGYNQSLLLARILAKAAGDGTKVVELLRKTIDTQSQTTFDRRARQRNLKNAFALVKRVAINPGQKIILVDDVFTTGSTLNACAAVLRRAGCLNLFIVTLGHG